MKCKCGNDKFYPATNDKFKMCSKCKTIYDAKNNVTEIKQPQHEDVKVIK